ncbi:MAG TPA: CAP domain-containing protein [Rhizomicrobium sp.]|jgi:uncharacterized protein YkwD|nr:CAP domain-containing protein [Rhizomicrobium sp.]
MTLSRWKPVFAFVIASVAVSDTANRPIVTATPQAIRANRPVVLAAKNPPSVTGSSTLAADTPTAVAENSPAAAVVKGPAADGLPTVTPVPPVTDAPVETVAKNPPPVMDAIDPPAVTGTKTVTAVPEVDAPSVMPAPSPPAAETKKPAPAFDGRILAAHNRERENLGLEPLSWNPALAQSAQRWADHLAQTGRFEHAPENHAAPEGENLWAGTRGYYSPEAMVNAWIREKRFFRPGAFPDNSTTGKVEDIGHYTQVVWRATRQVGCAEAASASEDILVCRYAEAGNYRGEQPF